MDSKAIGTSMSNVYAVSSNPTTAPPTGPLTAAALVPEPEPTGDVAFVMAKMMLENAYTNRAQARQDRQHATESMVAVQNEQIAHMRDAADARYEAAKLEAWGKIADGGFGAFGGCITAGAVHSNADDAGRTYNNGVGSVYSSTGHIASGIAGIAAGSARHEGDELDADAKAAENQATQIKRQIEGADDDVKEARDHMRAAIDFLREFESTKTKSMSSAIKA